MLQALRALHPFSHGGTLTSTICLSVISSGIQENVPPPGAEPRCQPAAPTTSFSSAAVVEPHRGHTWPGVQLRHAVNSACPLGCRGHRQPPGAAGITAIHDSHPPHHSNTWDSKRSHMPQAFALFTTLAQDSPPAAAGLEPTSTQLGSLQHSVANPRCVCVSA